MYVHGCFMCSYSLDLFWILERWLMLCGIKECQENHVWLLSESAAGKESLKNLLLYMTRTRIFSSRTESGFLRSKNGDIDNGSNYSRNCILLDWMCNGRFY